MIVAVDIDHTLSHAAWRDEHIAEAHASGKWDHYHSLAVDDLPAKPIIETVIALHRAGHEIFIVTARPRKWRRQTYAWLHRHGVCVEVDHILMRPDFEYRPAPEIKSELVAHLSVDLLIEDREDVADTFRDLGITTMLVRLTQ